MGVGVSQHVFIPGAIEKYSVEPDIPYVVLAQTEPVPGEWWATVIWRDGFVGMISQHKRPDFPRITLWAP